MEKKINENLVKNWEWAKKNFDSLVKIYRYKYILVYNEKVMGSYDTVATAANEGFTNFGIHSGFLVQFISDIEPLNIIMSAR